MNTFSNALYTYISKLGSFTIGIFSGFFKMLWKIPKKLFHFNKASFSSKKTFFKRAIAFVLSAVILTGSVLYLKAHDSKISAIAITLSGETIGYAQTQNDADHAAALALNALGMTSAQNLSMTEAKTEPFNIKNSTVLSKALISRLAPDYIKVTEIKIDGTVFCAVTDRQAALEVFEELLKDAQKQYPTSTVAFAEEIGFSYAYYRPSDKNIKTAEQLEIALSSLKPLTITHAECEKNLSSVDYDTVEIQTNTLFIGDSRVRREGQNGSEYTINLVTYNGDKKVLSERLMSVEVTQPISRVIERGIRAESLTIGTYTVLQTTGTFCWPVVGLYTVTSPFGYRSLGYHRGIDISGANASGSLVVAGASGTVVEAGWSTGGYGNYVIIDHGNGVETLYGHMLDNSLMVSAGDTVTKGQAIGRVGNTGYSFGAHLHFEVRINGNRYNPAPYLGLE